MNPNLKIAVGVFAGLIAGTTLVGTAIAAPGFSGTAPYGPGMMRQVASSATTFTAPTWSEMVSFMSQYRTASGTVDVSRMRTDIASGKVAPPCATATSAAGSVRRSAATSQRGPAMMRAWNGVGATGGYTMMGRSY